MPIGPWTPPTPGDGLVIEDRLVKDVITLDTQFFEDKDGTLYGHWGTWGIFPNSGCGWGVFNADMKSFARLGMIPNTQAKDFPEAPFMIERNGVYYFTYSSGSCHDASYRVQYAASATSPTANSRWAQQSHPRHERRRQGPRSRASLDSSSRATSTSSSITGTTSSVTPNGMHRQICADRLVFERDGVIKKTESTHQGIGSARPQVAAFEPRVDEEGHRLVVLPGHAPPSRIQARIRRGRQ